MQNRAADTAMRLRERKEEVLQLWENCVRNEIPESKNKDKAAIRNSLPDLLEKIIHTLMKNAPKNTAELQNELAIARQHGEQRAHFKNYSLEQVIHEYQLLRQVILEVLEDGDHLSRVDRDVILDAVSLSERIAASEYYRIQLNTERDLKTRTQERDEAEVQREISRSQVNNLVVQKGMREEFVSNLAHDLRTPLTAARMNLELLIKKRDEVGALEIHTGKVLGDILRLEKMIQDLLDANRIKAGKKLPIQVSQFDLIHEIKETLELLGSMHGDRFVLNADQHINGYWDKNGIRRILENLCGNALKYGDRLAPITVSVHSDNKKQRVEIRVHNWGTPISQEDQKTLFDQFSRAESARTRAHHGWGIGLALVRGMAESHDGSVRVESTAEKGTVFIVLLPLDSRYHATNFN